MRLLVQISVFPFYFQDCLQPLSMQALPAEAESLSIVEMGGGEASDKVTGGGLFLNIGLSVCFFVHVFQFTFEKFCRKYTSIPPQKSVRNLC